jgi:class 3 adenylate cyclase/tetratricopeptide (TPR) repeat protein
MSAHDLETADFKHSLHSYVSDHGLSMLASHPEGGWSEITGTLAFFDVSGFTRLTERLARLGRSGAEHINDVLNTIFEGLIDQVFGVDGDVLEFGGDAMVVLYDGDRHAERAAIAAARMFDFMSRDGLIETPLGNVRLRMSCGMASGTQAYHLIGTTRRALMVAGPVSTEMARLEAAASAGEALINDELAATLPRSWVTASKGGQAKLRMGAVAAAGPAVPRDRPPAADGDVNRLLPTQFHSLVDVHHRAGELKQVAMGFIRLSGTDDLLVADGVDRLHRRLQEITDIVDSTAAELDVCWLETQAEANSVRWTLIAGAPTATERDGERLLRVLRRVAERSSLPLRIGANLGVVFVGDMGHPQRCTFIVMGDATNLAARLMARAHPGEIIAGERLHDTCPRRFESTPLEPFVVKGKSAPVRAFVVGRVVEGDAAATQRVDPADLVGRDDELEAVRRAVAEGGIVDLVGEAGSGKTRLWHEARDADASRNWLVARAESHEIDSPNLPFRRLIRTAVGIGGRDDPATAGTSLATFVKRWAKDLVPWLPLIADVVGASVAATDAVNALDPAFRAERLHSVTAELIAAIAGADGVVVLEDLHWIDDSSRALLEALCSWPDRGAAVIVTRRPDGIAPPATLTVRLAPLDDEQADRLLLRELPALAASDATLARLRASAGGNPLFLVELARAVANSTSSFSPSTTAYPDSIERLLAARIDELPIAGRELIHDASVLGSTINRDLAARVLARPDLRFADTWERELGDLMAVEDDSVIFRNELVRLAAYEGLSVRRRRAVHERAGDVIEEWGDSAPLADPIGALAFHAAGSARPERIVRWCTEAADAAIAVGAMEIAESLLEDVVVGQRRLGVENSVRCATQRRLAFAAERAGHPETALEALGDAARLANERERALVAVDRSRLLEKLGRYRAGLTLTARALKTCTDPDVAASLKLARAAVYNFRGQFRACLDTCESVLDDATHTENRRLIAQAHLLAEWCCASLGLPERSAHERAALALLVELGDSIGLANLHLNRGETAWLESRVGDALDDFAKSSEYYLRAGDVVGAALADNNMAEILTLQHRLDEAEALLENARRVLQAANYPLGTVITTSGLSRIAAWRGETREALRLQTDALGDFRLLGAEDYVMESLVRLVEIHVLEAEAAAAAALDAAAEARRVLEGSGDVPVLPGTLSRLEARARRLSGDVVGARSLLQQALDAVSRDGFDYEVALATLAIGRMDGDDDVVEDALGRLRALGVVRPPPGS